jgi:hypothetical protein
VDQTVREIVRLISIRIGERVACGEPAPGHGQAHAVKDGRPPTRASGRNAAAAA